ncbi:MAG TPA: long-chain fatty acid--CoA ligase [Rhodopila sp.]|uniref:AMP-dependent synthetase/ligase n=1 Tax=Rhodopila sp. TaxID=2480087 RepID=UPI002CC620B2|nr:long-chain fatty acid--CoA ligase [Rhodopila sp.]HVY13829.1 long-chain fatty acid--CoA ligase [Rhodopila sp.]
MAIATIPALVLDRAATHPDRTILRRKDRGIWKSMTWSELAARMLQVAEGLRTSGIGPGDRVCILSETTPQWVFADLGVLSAGAVSVGIYPTADADLTAEILAHCGARLVFAENEEQLDKILQARPRCPKLERIVIFNMKGLRDLSEPGCESFDTFLGRVRDGSADLPALDPHRTATLIYTVGTTGAPKGSMLTHHNLLCQVGNAAKLMNLRAGDERLAFLPMSHAIERVLGLYLSLYSGVISNYVESADTVAEDLREAKPTVFLAPPHVWERFHSRITVASASAGLMQRLLYRWAMAAGAREAGQRLAGRSPSSWTALHARVLRWLVLGNVLRELGLVRLRVGLIGASPVSPELVRWLMALGLDVQEFYGQTECGGLTALMPREAIRSGCVGKPVPYAEIALAPDNEILVRGDHVFVGYWDDAERTSRALRDGWLHTGDVGSLEGGYLRVVGRAEDLVTTVSGVCVTATEIERELKLSPYIADAVVLGEQREFLACLVMTDPDVLEGWAQQNNIAFTTYSALVRAEPVRDLIRREIAVASSRLSASVEIRSFRMIEEKLAPDDPELTPMMKLRRAIVGEKYRGLIEDMYSRP